MCFAADVVTIGVPNVCVNKNYRCTLFFVRQGIGGAQVATLDGYFLRAGFC